MASSARCDAKPHHFPKDRIMRGPSVLLVAALAFPVGACGGEPTEPNGDGATQVTLTSSLSFSPSDLTIDPGTTVRWVATTSTFHTITPSNLTQTGVWAKATTSSSGSVLSHTFTVPGQVYSYFCEVHTGMNGVNRVR
jgi:plastocyanin